MASPITIICFDYGGSYIKDGADLRWISEEDEIHTLVMKTSVEEVTYSDLVERICRKIKANGDGMGMLKISYFPMVLYSNKPSYIWCDENVLGYLMQVNNEKCRSVLHVEINKDIYDAYGALPLSEKDDGTDDNYVGLSDRKDADTNESEENEYEEDESKEDGTKEDGTKEDGTKEDGTEKDGTENVEMDGVVTLYTAEQQQDIEMHENLEHGYEGTEVRAEVEAARPGVEATTVVDEELDDGIDFVKGQEFRTKTVVQVLVQRGAHKNGFEY
ncbi:hypothetical protein N665_0116s0059 [Sinapis alba]|nr:hypothetical protein N665_0116s0059 [Sinapis alba]